MTVVEEKILSLDDVEEMKGHLEDVLTTFFYTASKHNTPQSYVREVYEQASASP